MRNRHKRSRLEQLLPEKCRQIHLDFCSAKKAATTNRSEINVCLFEFPTVFTRFFSFVIELHMHVVDVGVVEVPSSDFTCRRLDFHLKSQQHAVNLLGQCLAIVCLRLVRRCRHYNFRPFFTWSSSLSFHLIANGNSFEWKTIESSAGHLNHFRLIIFFPRMKIISLYKASSLCVCVFFDRKRSGDE